MATVDWFAASASASASASTDAVAEPVRRPRPRPQSERRARRRRQTLRLRGGIFWIAAFAVLLVGVVAVNVAVLRVTMSVGDLNRQQLDLQAQNQALASQVSSAGSSLRIEQAARRLGLVPAPASDTSYLDLGR